MHMNTKKYKSRLMAQHRMQLRLFKRILMSLTEEFALVDEAKVFLEPVKKMAATLDEQTAAAELIFAIGPSLAGEGNRSPSFMALGGGSLAYNFLTANRKLVEQLGDLDEFHKALALDAEIQAKSRPFHGDDKVWNAACALSWQLGAAQYRIGALARAAQALTATQEALFRAYGLQFWQGHKRYLRWEGDER